MPRIARMLNGGEQTVYHVISRTAFDGFPFNDIEKDEFVKIIKRFSVIYFVDIVGFCIMGNHFHLLAKMHPESDFTDEDIHKDSTFFMMTIKTSWIRTLNFTGENGRIFPNL